LLDSDADNEKQQSNLNVDGTSSTPKEKVGTFTSLRIRNFRYLLGGTTLSNAAMWIQQVTMSWLVYDLTGSGIMLGSINMVRSIASLAMIPIAGLLIDRTDRRRLMMITNGWLLVISLILGFILLFERSYLLYLFAFSFLAGLVQTIDSTLRQVVVFDLVPRFHAPNALALIQTGWSLMRSFGPGIGGYLLLWLGPGGNFLVQASAYALITISIMQIQFPPRKSDLTRSSPLQNIREGIQYITKMRTTRIFTLIGFILPLFVVPIFNILLPIYAKDVFKGKVDVLGFLLASIGIGGIVGGLVTASLGRVERRGLVQLVSLFLLSLTLIGFAFSKTLWTSMGLLALAGFFEIIFMTTNQTLLQFSIPDNLRGRVTSVVNLNFALAPLAGLIVGGGSDLLEGPQMITIILSGIIAIITVCIFIVSPTVRNYRLNQTITSDSTTSIGSDV
jgi:MFS family permease